MIFLDMLFCIFGCRQNRTLLHVLHVLLRLYYCMWPCSSYCTNICDVLEDNQGKPRILFGYYFNMPDYGTPPNLTDPHLDNMYIVPGPDSNINPDNSVVQVQITNYLTLVLYHMVSVVIWSIAIIFGNIRLLVQPIVTCTLYLSAKYNTHVRSFLSRMLL